MALLRSLAKLLQETVRRDPLFAEEVRHIVNEHVAPPEPKEPAEPKRELRDDELTPGQLVVRQAYRIYKRAEAEEVPPPGLIARWAKQWAGADKLYAALNRMHQEGYLLMPLAYQMKVMASWIKRGSLPPARGRRRGDHTTAGAAPGDKEAIRRRLDGGTE